MRFAPAALLLATLASGQTISNFAGNGAAGYAGDTGPATQAKINRVVGLATDAAGNVYMADQNNNVVRKVDTSGTITTFAGTGAQGFSGDNGPATQALLNGPLGVCVAPSGVVYVNDQGNHRVRAISTNGTITTVAGSSTALSFGDGNTATSAGMVIPIRCAVDQNGNLYIVDQGAHNIRKVNTSGIISTFAGIANAQGFTGDGGPAVAAQMNNPTAAVFDTTGNLFVTDQSNQRIRKIDTSGIITTVAGNGVNAFFGDHLAATSASLNFPGETVVDSAGNLFIVDTVNQVIRMVSGGIISTVAGLPGVIGNNGDGGSPLLAQFNSPFAMTLDPSANLYIGDTGNNRIRKISGLASATANCTFSLSSGGQAFTSAGGSGSVIVSTQIGCNWTIPNIPSWITITSFPSSGSGTVAFQVAANAGPDRTVTLTSNGVSFTVEQQAASIVGLNFVGSMPHIAAQEHWTTLFTLVNKGPASTQARLSLFGDAANPTGNGPLTLPLAFPQQSGASGPLLASTFDRTIASNASLVVTTAEAQSQPVLVGSAQLAAVGQVDGFAIFHLIPGAQEAVVPMETRNASSYLLAYDNTGNVRLGVAVENVSSQDAIIPIVIRDETGALIGPPGFTISLAGNGHTSFVVSDLFPTTAGKHGTIEFDTPAGGQISVLGIRTTPLGTTTTLTTIPPLANVGTTGGSIAHIATGNGWQTTFVLVNTGTTAAQVNLNFFADITGAPLPLPLSFPLISSSVTSVSPNVNQLLPAGATLLVQSIGQAADPSPTVGSAQLTTNGHVGGFVIFHFSNGQEAVVPLESRQTSGYIVAFDNTAGTATGIAINSVSTQALNVPVIVRNDAGVRIATDTLNLAANGHLAFALGDKYSAAATIRGTIEFDTPPGGQIGVLGIRTPVAHTFTTLPALTR